MLRREQVFPWMNVVPGCLPIADGSKSPSHWWVYLPCPQFRTVWWLNFNLPAANTVIPDRRCDGRVEPHMFIKVIFCRHPANILPDLEIGNIKFTPIGVGLKRERIDMRGGLSQLGLLPSSYTTIDRVDIRHTQVPDIDSQTTFLQRRDFSHRWPDQQNRPCGIRVCICTQPSDPHTQHHRRRCGDCAV